MSEMSNEFPANAFVAPHVPAPVEAAAPAAHDTVDSLDAAAILRVTPNNLRQIVHKKQLLPVGKRGRRTLFNRADVEALAAVRGNGAGT